MTRSAHRIPVSNHSSSRLISSPHSLSLLNFRAVQHCLTDVRLACFPPYNLEALFTALHTLITNLHSIITMVRVAAVQAASVGFDLQASIAKLQRLVAEAKENGAELVVLPEAFLSAYPRHYNVGVGYRTQDNRDWYGKYVQVSAVGSRLCSCTCGVGIHRAHPHLHVSNDRVDPVAVELQ